MDPSRLKPVPLPTTWPKLRKLQSVPLLPGIPAPDPDAVVAVLVKRMPGASLPACAAVRSEISCEFLTADVRWGDLPTLDADPDIESFALAQPLKASGTS